MCAQSSICRGSAILQRRIRSILVAAVWSLLLIPSLAQQVQEEIDLDPPEFREAIWGQFSGWQPEKRKKKDKPARTAPPKILEADAAAPGKAQVQTQTSLPARPHSGLLLQVDAKTEEERRRSDTRREARAKNRKLFHSLYRTLHKAKRRRTLVRTADSRRQTKPISNSSLASSKEPRAHKEPAGLTRIATTSSGQLQRIGKQQVEKKRKAEVANNSSKAGHLHGPHSNPTSPDQSQYARNMREHTKKAMRRKAKLAKAVGKKEGSNSVAEGARSGAAGKGRAHRRLLSKRADLPQFENPSFEEGSTTDTYKTARTIPGWKKYGRALQFVRNGADVYDEQKAASGNYLMAFLANSAGLWQGVDGHTIGNYYRLVFNTGHRQGFSCPDDDPCRMDIFVMDRPKRWTDEPTTSLDTESSIQWYEIAYIASAEKMYFAFVYGGPYEFGRAVFLDDVGIRVVEPWVIGGPTPFVLLQTVSCTDRANPTADTCAISDYVQAGEFDGDGVTTAPFTGVASKKAVWVAQEHCQALSDGTQLCSGKFKFRASGLRMASAITNSTGDNWYLDSGYTECSVKNAFSTQTTMFQVNTNDMGYYTLSDQGVKCGFMFLIQAFKQTEVSFAR